MPSMGGSATLISAPHLGDLLDVDMSAKVDQSLPSYQQAVGKYEPLPGVVGDGVQGLYLGPGQHCRAHPAGLIVTPYAPPDAPTLSASAHPGGVPIGDWIYVIGWDVPVPIDGGGSAVSASAPITLAAASAVTITPPAAPAGVTGWFWWRSNDAGASYQFGTNALPLGAPVVDTNPTYSSDTSPDPTGDLADMSAGILRVGSILCHLGTGQTSQFGDAWGNVALAVGGAMKGAQLNDGLGVFGATPPAAKPAITGALATVTDPKAKAVLTSIIAALVGCGLASNGTT